MHKGCFPVSIANCQFLNQIPANIFHTCITAFWSTITSPVYSLLVITLTQSSYIEVNHIFGYLAPIDPFSVPFLVKNVEQLCYKSHWFPKGNSGFWQWNSQMGCNRLLHHIISLTIWLSESHMVEKPMDRMRSRWRDTKN